MFNQARWRAESGRPKRQSTCFCAHLSIPYPTLGCAELGKQPVTTLPDVQRLQQQSKHQ